ncbi:HAD family hydrolase (plasmid) [Skermanella rosea]|uniref:HAD family hydrolase n=1 Tax=Skermanella rosea TaxID=1817965 RepID=UPI0019330A15|nr:HAD family hydrolase [Skermanella rosea]UEM07067.1 HAD family hydrolase [Skermanella rosea]
MTLQAIIFDVDGTLAETEEEHRRAFNETFGSFGLDWHWDRRLYAELLRVTGGKERIRDYVSRHRPAEAGRVEPIVGEIHRAKTDRYVSNLAADGIALRPGVARLIREAADAGLRLAIATTTSLPNVKILLKQALGPDALGLFEVIAAGDMVEAKKPAPDVYLLALDRLGLPGQACVAIEDSYNGVMAARRAGIPTLATTSDYTRFEDLRYAMGVLSDLGEPDAPFLHLGGIGAGERCVTVEMLRRYGRSTTLSAG